MSTGLGIRAGRAFMEFFVDDSKVQQGLTRMQRTFRAWGTRIAGVGATLTGVGAAMVAPMALFTREAGNAEVVTKLLSERFGALSKDAVDFASRYAEATEKSKFTIMEALSVFQSFFLGLKFGRDESALMSKALVEMSADLAATNPQISGMDDAIRRFISAMSGSAEVLDRFGINLKVSAIDQELLALGFTETSTTATEQQKTIARLSASYKALVAQGSLGKAIELVDSFRNQLAGIGENFKTFRIAIGTALTTGTRPFLVTINNIIKGMTLWAEQNQEVIVSFAKIGVGLIAAGSVITGVGLAIHVFGLALAGLAMPLGIVGKLITGVTAVVSGLATVFGAPLGVLITSIAIAVLLLSDFTDAWKSLSEGATSSFATIMTGLKTMSIFLREGEFEKAWQVFTITIELAWKQMWVAIMDAAKQAWQSIKQGWGELHIVMAEILMTAQLGMEEMYRDWSRRIGHAAASTWQMYTETLRKIAAKDLDFTPRQMAALQKVFDQERDALGKAFEGQAVIDAEEETKAVKELEKEIRALYNGDKSPLEGLFDFTGPEEAKKSIEELKAQLEALRAEAEALNVADPYEAIGEKFLETLKKVAGMLQAGGDVSKGFSIFGSFSSRALGQLQFGSGSYAKKTADNTAGILSNSAQTNTTLTNIHTEIEGMGVFV